MPPKKENKKNKDKYVLIWWVIDGQKSITELNKIPKAKRIKNETVKLKWEGKEGKKFYFAKIIEYGETIEELENVRLDNKGNVCDQSTKMYSENVLQKKKAMDVSKQLSKEFTKKHNNDMEHKIIQQKAIFSIDEQPFSECHRDKIIKFKKANEGEKLSKTDDQNSEPSEQELINHQSTPPHINTLEISHTASQQDTTIDKSIPFFDKSFIHLFNSNNSLINQIHPENSAENSELYLAPIWNSNYFNNWSNMNNQVMIAQDFQFQGFNEADQVLSSNLLEVGSLEKGVCNTPISKFPSSLTDSNTNKNSTIFRPWDLLEATKNITAINTSATSTTFICSEFAEEEICLESTQVSADIDIPVGLSDDLENRERTINVGSLATYLKHEGSFD